MLARRFISFFRASPSPQFFSSVKTVDEPTSKSFGRKAVSYILITVTGGVALSALNDLVIYQGCSSKALEKASKDQLIMNSLGEPIKKGPWYNASLAVAHKRHSVSCSFPVSGPQGSGILQLKAIRKGDDWISYVWPKDWEILVMEALLHVPGNEDTKKAFRLILSEKSPACTDCKPEKSDSPEKR